MPAPAAIQAATLDKFIEAWKQWSPGTFFTSWTDNCTMRTLPFSAGVPLRARPETEKFLPVLMGLMSNFELTVHNVVHDAAQGKAAIYALSKADTPVGPYSNEHALFVWFDESGEKVTKIEEMFDSIVIKDFFPKVQAYIAQQKSQGPAA
ncbi:hypothetical protein VTG60DRAFT_6687 [Thermothelomyces hinnuleus]